MKKHCFLPRPSVKVANEMHIAQPDKIVNLKLKSNFRLTIHPKSTEVLTHPNCLIQITKRKKRRTGQTCNPMIPRYRIRGYSCCCTKSIPYR